MRTFHIGGAASKIVEQTVLEAKNSGTIKFININTVKNREGLLVVMNRNVNIAVVDSKGREKEIPCRLWSKASRRQRAEGGNRTEAG